jgi:predicted amidohydrolase YtcJ
MDKQQHADLILTNARVLTMEPGMRPARWVAIRDRKILHVGTGGAAGTATGPHTREIDCQGMTLLPGFVDAHCHLMALASSLRGVDCRPQAATSISRLVEAIGRRARLTPPGRWVRAFGYDEFYLAEGRHPTRWDLDRASSGHPVRLDHRTGHASVLNSLALGVLGISRETSGPPEGVIERDGATGEPTGVLFEMAGYLRDAIQRLVAAPSEDGAPTLHLREGIGEVNRMLLSRGITSVHDAGPGNGLDRWRAFLDLKEHGHLAPRVVMMAGASHWEAFREAGMVTGVGEDGLRLGAVKLMLSLATGALLPGAEELRELAMGPHRNGFQLAFHAVEQEAVEAAADAILHVHARWPRPDARHRIEHCAEGPPRVLRKVKDSRAVVVTQPAFIYHNGDKYLSLVEKGLRAHLYPLGDLAAAGIPVAAGSDAPVTVPDPLLSIYASVARTTSRDVAFDTGPSQALSRAAALDAHTLGGAFAALNEGKTGSISPGKLADLALLDADPMAVEVEALKEIRVMMTLVDGKVAWER